MDDKLNEKQKKFAEEYLVDFNGTRAAIAAGYKEKNAKVIASQNLTKLNIQQYICKLQEEKKKKFEITEERIINELASIAFAKASDYVKIVPEYDDYTGKNKATLEYVETDELSEEQKAAISEISKTEKGIKIRLSDKTKALELLGKQLGMFSKIEINGKVTTEMTETDRKLLENVQKRFDANA